MFSLLDADPGFISELFARSHYLAPFCVLLLCGVGLPLPEEVTLIGSGLLLFQGRVNFWAISAVCGSAILIGDSVPYWLGRHYGMAALRIRWVGRVLHPERFALLEQRFAEHGNWAVFTCRFLPGLRLPGYFTAGTLGMSYARFLLLDFLGVLLSVPASIYLGKLFGGSVESLKDNFTDLHLILAFGVVSLLLIMFVRTRGMKRSREAKQRALAESVEKPVKTSDSASSQPLPGGPEPGAPVSTRPRQSAGR